MILRYRPLKISVFAVYIIILIHKCPTAELGRPLQDVDSIRASFSEAVWRVSHNDHLSLEHQLKLL